MKYLIFALLLTGCTNADLEEVTHYYSTRAEVACEEFTASNGVTLDECNLTAGGEFASDIIYSGSNGAHFQAFTLNNGSDGWLDVAPESVQLFTNSSAGGTIIESTPTGINLFSSGNVSMKISNQGVEIKAAGQNRVIVTNSGKIILVVPSSSIGLTTGMVYKDSNGFLKLTP